MDFPFVKKDAKIVVAMSGGVDSSTVAALLKAHGYRNLQGITLKLYDNNSATGIECKDTSFNKDAQTVAKHLQIPHTTLDLKETFWDLVIDPFLKSYVSGVTPSPCITCNREIKFGALWQEAKKLGAEILVTGHYIKWDYNDGNPAIRMNRDSIRDQSYFLAKINKQVLAKVRFPLANLTKQEVRNIAEEYGLHTAQKSSSNDICFAGGNGYSNLIKKSDYQVQLSGDIINSKGEVLGTHRGIFNYTIGQRRGIGVSSATPMFVTHIDAVNNTITVGPKEQLARREVIVHNVNWLGEGNFLDSPIKSLQAKVRASQQMIDAVIEALDEKKAKVTFLQDVFGVAPGQVCAFYKNDRLLGGGDI